MCVAWDGCSATLLRHVRPRGSRCHMQPGRFAVIFFSLPLGRLFSSVFRAGLGRFHASVAILFPAHAASPVAPFSLPTLGRYSDHLHCTTYVERSRYLVGVACRYLRGTRAQRIRYIRQPLARARALFSRPFFFSRPPARLIGERDRRGMKAPPPPSSSVAVSRYFVCNSALPSTRKYLMSRTLLPQ